MWPIKIKYYANCSKKAEPSPSLLCTCMVPLCSIIICLQRLGPIPLRVLRVLEKRMNIFSTISSVMPAPLSAIFITTLLAGVMFAYNKILGDAFSFTASAAFTTRFINTFYRAAFWQINYG